MSSHIQAESTAGIRLSGDAAAAYQVERIGNADLKVGASENSFTVRRGRDSHTRFIT